MRAQMFYVPVLAAALLARALYELRWYFFLVKRPKNTSGIIRLRILRCSVFMLLSTFMVVHRLRALFGRRGRR